MTGQEEGDQETGTSGLGAWDEEDERALWGVTLQQVRAWFVVCLLRSSRVVRNSPEEFTVFGT